MRRSELAICVAILMLGDQLVWRAQLGTGALGISDETTHLLTGVLVLAALPRHGGAQFALGLLASSVLIDLDHVPGELGFDAITRGTQRPYTHSLLTLAGLALLAVLFLRRHPAWGWFLRGAVVGTGVHLFRDMTEASAGVPLLWPLRYTSYTLPHWVFLALIAVLAPVALVSAPARQAARPGTTAGRRA